MHDEQLGHVDLQNVHRRVDDPDDHSGVGVWLDTHGYTVVGTGRRTVHTGMRTVHTGDGDGDGGGEEGGQPHAMKAKKQKPSQPKAEQARARGVRKGQPGGTVGTTGSTGAASAADGLPGIWALGGQKQNGAQGEEGGEIDKQATLAKVPRALPVTCNGYPGTLDCLSLNVSNPEGFIRCLHLLFLHGSKLLCCSQIFWLCCKFLLLDVLQVACTRI